MEFHVLGISALGLLASVVHGSALPAQIHFAVTDGNPAASSFPNNAANIQGHRHDFPVYWQDERTCNTSLPQFTGTVPISPEKNLFFWFVESQDAAQKPTVLWLNGGPGASSLAGLFNGIGPCDLSSENHTVENPFSWSNFANLLFLDQPVGVGMSTVTGDNPVYPVTLDEGSIDFSAFLALFAHQYPTYFDHGLYIAGESFGGRYAPRYAADILRKQLARSPDALGLAVGGVILVNALVDGIYPSLGNYELFCTGEWQDMVRFNETTCRALAAAMPEAEKLQHLCQATYDPYVCMIAYSYVEENIERYFKEQEVDTERHSPYDLRLGCDRPPFCIPQSVFAIDPYLNQSRVKKLLGVAEDLEFKSINFTLNALWTAELDINLPTTRDVSYILDEGGVKLLGINGNMDAVMPSAGTYRQYNELPWSRNVQFRLDERKDWNYIDSDGRERKGGKRKGTRLLQLADVDNAGHMCTADQKEAVASLVRDWIDSEREV